MDLQVAGVGVHLPSTYDVAHLAAAAGADVSGYRGWKNVCRADGDEHPSSMAKQALDTALADGEVSPADLSLVISAGVSRDYPPSWSLATAVMAELPLSPACFGIDMTIGCLGLLAAIDFANGWLTTRGGGFAAVVTAERWGYTVDMGSRESMSIWAHGDSASALVLSMNRPSRAVTRLVGTAFTTDNGLNGHVLVPYGGTVAPTAPPGESPFQRRLSSIPRRELGERYRRGYHSAFSSLTERFGVPATTLVCNQISPNFVHALSELSGVGEERTVITGDRYGHLGSVDVAVGLHALMRNGRIGEPVLAAASTAYAFGAALFGPTAG